MDGSSASGGVRRIGSDERPAEDCKGDEDEDEAEAEDETFDTSEAASDSDAEEMSDACEDEEEEAEVDNGDQASDSASVCERRGAGALAAVGVEALPVGTGVIATGATSSTGHSITRR